MDEVLERIETAARESFVKRGYSASTTREIALAANLTPGALYVHFPGKEALFAAVIRGYNARFLDLRATPVGKVLARARFPFDLPELAAAIRSLVRKHREYWLLWYIDILEFQGKHFRSRLAPEVVMRMPALIERFEALRRDRVLAVDPAFAFRMVYMHLFNYFLVETLFGGKNHYGLPGGQAVETISRVFLQGILARGTDPLPATAP